MELYDGVVYVNMTDDTIDACEVVLYPGEAYNIDLFELKDFIEDTRFMEMIFRGYISILDTNLNLLNPRDGIELINRLKKAGYNGQCESGLTT